MRRRFGRGRRGPARVDRGAPIDAERWLRRILDDGVVAATSITPFSGDGIPDTLAAVGVGEAQDGSRLVVGFSPRSGADAALAAAAAAVRLKPDGFTGEVIAVAPDWSAADRRRLSLLAVQRLRALWAPALAEGNAPVASDTPELPWPLSIESVSANLADADERFLFVRAAASLEGLASKHGGVVRGIGRRLELVLMARRIAALHAADEGPVLELLVPERSSTRLGADQLADRLDDLEGQVRRRLNDRRVRDGEEGLRSRVLPLLVSAASLRSGVAWPLPDGDRELLDWVGVGADGQVAICAVRKQLSLLELGPILDAVQRLRPLLPALLAGIPAPLRTETPRLVLAAESIDTSASDVLAALALDCELYRARSGRFRGLTLEPVQTQGRERAAVPARGGEREPAGPAASPAAGTAEQAPDAERRPEGRGRSRRRSGRRRSRRGGEGEEVASGAEEESPASGRADAPQAGAPRFEEVSLFDLDDDRSEPTGDEAGARRRRGGRNRSRGRRRRGRGEGDGEARAEEDPEPAEDTAGGRSASRKAADRPQARESEPERIPVALVDEDGVDDLLPQVAELPELEIVPEPAYDDEDEVAGEAVSDGDSAPADRQKAGRDPSAKVAIAPAEKPKPPRRRAAIVAHADRDSVMAAVLLARDIRLLEGFWVYPQDELMTFFRSVATDLREGTPIHVVGFEPRPARDVLQAVSLYGEGLAWFDCHEWPPEDREAMRQAIGDDGLHLTPGVSSSIPSVLSTCTRRSRFTDKLVDLAVARFSVHDYERWGRLWSSRIAEIASKPGDRRADIEPLLAGRPSDLADEAARSPVPPLPPELQFVAERDFRLVYFGGYTLVVIEPPTELDALFCARVARERYGASLSLVVSTQSETLALAGDELPGRRSFDLRALVEHLVTKLVWVEALAGDDHVARFRVRDLAAQPERLDEVIGEIAMGRSILEG